MTAIRESNIRVAQRQMIRKMVQTARRRHVETTTPENEEGNQHRKQEVEELWTEWIARATREVERHCERAKIGLEPRGAGIGGGLVMLHA